MAPRLPATTTEIIDALRRGDEHNALAEDRAVSWASALLLLRPALRTTAPRAEQWLTDAVLAPGSELVVIDPRDGAAIRAARPDATAPGWMPLTELGWNRDEAENLIIGWDGRPHDRAPGPGQYVMLRSSLEYFRVHARQRAARRAAAAATEVRTRRAQFAQTHGDALDRVYEALAGLPLLDGEELEDRVVTFNPYGGRPQDGLPGSVTIHVRGPQIRGLVDLLTAGATAHAAAGT